MTMIPGTQNQCYNSVSVFRVLIYIERLKWYWGSASVCELCSVSCSWFMFFLYFSPDISPPPACGVLYPSFDRNRFQAYLTKPMYPSQTHAKSKYCVGQAAVEDCLSYPSPISFKATSSRANREPQKQRKGGSPRVVCTGIKKLSESDGRETFNKTSDEVILKVDLCPDLSVDDRVCTSKMDQAHSSADDQNSADQARARINLSQCPTAANTGYPGIFCSPSRNQDSSEDLEDGGNDGTVPQPRNGSPSESPRSQTSRRSKKFRKVRSAGSSLDKPTKSNNDVLSGSDDDIENRIEMPKLTVISMRIFNFFWILCDWRAML